jgi:alpha-tubulin suppressor-like RCC1 family protein
LDNQAVDVAFNVAFDATGATSYANTTALPAGTALLSNGYFYGTITGIESETTYNFTVSAIDAENQDSPREFSVTVTVAPTYFLYAFGNGTRGQLGTNDVINRSSPTQIGTFSWTSISAGGSFSLAVKDDGTLWSWGTNNVGKLGHNDLIYRSSPTQVGSLTDWSMVSCGSYSDSGAIKTNGTLWVWGSTNGTGNNINKSSPTQVGTDTNWSKLNISQGFNGAIKTNNTLWTWGLNNNGQLGHGDYVNKSSPVQVGTDTNWATIALGRRHSMASKTDGSLYLCGQGGYGQLGTNSGASTTTLTRIGALNNWPTTMDKIGACLESSAAIKDDGTLWTWGRNDGGKLGKNNTVNYSSPVQVGTDTNWNVLAHGLNQMFSIKTDGTLWAWGYNNSGMLGDNTIISKSSPVQIGSDTDWISVSCSHGENEDVIGKADAFVIATKSS